MPIMIIVSLWSSMGVGFLAILAGILNINPEYYEAASLDGLRNRFQEIFYITIPQMKPQMMFAAVMAVVNTFSVGAIGVQLSGSNPTPGYAGQLIVNHIEDYGFILRCPWCCWSLSTPSPRPPGRCSGKIRRRGHEN